MGTRDAVDRFLTVLYPNDIKASRSVVTVSDGCSPALLMVVPKQSCNEAAGLTLVIRKRKVSM